MGPLCLTVHIIKIPEAICVIFDILKHWVVLNTCTSIKSTPYPKHPRHFSCNSSKHYPTLTIFDSNITEWLSNQKLVYFPPHLNSVSAPKHIWDHAVHNALHLQDFLLYCTLKCRSNHQQALFALLQFSVQTDHVWSSNIVAPLFGSPCRWMMLVISDFYLCKIPTSVVFAALLLTPAAILKICIWT